MSADPPPAAGRTRVRQTQEQRTAESTRRILRAAIELFAEQGYEHTTTEQIAAAAGYSRSMVNARFGSKEGLLERFLGVEWEGRLIDAATGAEDDGRARVLAVLDTVRRLEAEDPTFLRASLVVSFEAAGPLTGLRVHVVERLARIEAAIVDALARGLADGSIRSDVDPRVMGRQIVNAALGALYRWVVDPDSQELGERLEEVRAGVIGPLGR